MSGLSIRIVEITKQSKNEFDNRSTFYLWFMVIRKIYQAYMFKSVQVQQVKNLLVGQCDKSYVPLCDRMSYHLTKEK